MTGLFLCGGLKSIYLGWVTQRNVIVSSYGEGKGRELSGRCGQWVWRDAEIKCKLQWPWRSAFALVVGLDFLVLRWVVAWVIGKTEMLFYKRAILASHQLVVICSQHQPVVTSLPSSASHHQLWSRRSYNMCTTCACMCMYVQGHLNCVMLCCLSRRRVSCHDFVMIISSLMSARSLKGSLHKSSQPFSGSHVR